MYIHLIHTLRSTVAAALGLFVCMPAFGEPAPDETYIDMFEPMFTGAILKEKLPVFVFPGGTADEYLERRSALFEVTDQPEPILVERLYLVKKLPDGTITPSSVETDPSLPLRALDAPGGRLVQSAPMISTRIGVQMRYDHTHKEMEDYLKPRGMSLVSAKHSDRYFIVKITGSVQDAINTLMADTARVVEAERDYPLQSHALEPNDPRFNDQWHLRTIKAPEAWDTTVGHGTNLADPIERDKANKTIVAVIDTGVNNGLVGSATVHPDLRDNIWVNPNDPDDTTNTDNDGIGGINDTSGWNFVSNSKFPNDDTSRHGTHVAGVIGARGHNLTGVSGVAWRIRLLPLKATTTAEAALACNYVRALNNHPQQNVRVAVVNHSYGFAVFTPGLYNAINNTQLDTSVTPPANILAKWDSGAFFATASTLTGDLTKIKPGMTVSIVTSETPTRVLDVWNNNDGTYKLTLSGATTSPSPQGNPTAISFPFAYRSQPYGAVHVAAAGHTATAQARNNLDNIPIFPACYPSDLLVSVGGSTQPTTMQPDEFPTRISQYFSNYGARAVDLFAPGHNILSTTTGYAVQHGTSAAAGQVSGAIALMRMVYPTAPDRQIVAGIIAAHDTRPGLNGFSLKGGRLNVHKAVTQALP